MNRPPPPPENTADSPRVLRAAWRSACIAARLALPAQEHARLSAQIHVHLARELANFPPGILSWCSPIRGEFDARPLVEALLQSGWQAAMPVVQTRQAAMVFRPWSPGCALRADPHDIPVPDTDQIATPTVILIPLVAFDDAGFRLGYGGGYFDRTFSSLAALPRHPRPLRLGVGFELAHRASVLPQAHDIPLDAVVTEAGVRWFKKT